MEGTRRSIAPRVVAALFLLGMLSASPLIDAKSFDFYYLVLLWPGAYCAQSKCCKPTAGKPANDFFVRGLWAVSNESGKVVTKCNGTSFDVNQLSSLMDELHAYWSNIRCPSNNGVSAWRSAWRTYGRCSGMNVNEYFETALNLRAKADVLSHLKNEGIVPSLSQQYYVDDIENAIAEGIGAAPVLRCSKDREGYFQVYEIYICVNKDGKTIIECPVKPRFTCDSEVRFRPFNAGNLTDNNAANPIKMPISVE